MNANVIHTGDCLEELRQLPDGCVHSVMTSPPYWNLRDYGHDDQLGLEETPEAYVSNLAGVFDEVQRVLREDGSLWLNLGDTYEDKDLQQIPARVALELQDRGWILRNRVTWAKPNPMPQSVKDRLNDTTEVVFHLVKDREYWYDLDAIRQPHAESTARRIESNPTNVKEQGHKRSKDNAPGNNDKSGGLNEPGKNYADNMNTAGKNPGDVFEVTTKPFPDAHFAVYPPELCEKPIKATCPPKVCVACGSPYEREVEKTQVTRSDLPKSHPQYRERKYEYDNPDEVEYKANRHHSEIEHKGWTPTCDCDTDATEPGIILDPFAGAGTTLLKAKELGRKFVGIEINPEYADMARGRVGLTPDDPSNIRDDENQSGLEAYE